VAANNLLETGVSGHGTSLLRTPASLSDAVLAVTTTRVPVAVSLVLFVGSIGRSVLAAAVAPNDTAQAHHQVLAYSMSHTLEVARPELPTT